MNTVASAPPIVVVGNGLFGAAATRHLAERGAAVTCVGPSPDRPDIRVDVDTSPPGHRVYSSHNDAARLTRLQDRDARWAKVTERAIREYRSLESASGVSFFSDVGCLIASRPGGDGRHADPVATMQATDVGHVFHDVGDASWQARWPQISFPATHYVAFEPSPAGYIRPKALVQAQNVLSVRAGATLIDDTVIAVEEAGSVARVVTAGNRMIEASRVLVAAGAFTNFNKLLPSPLDLKLKSEVIVLGEVSEANALALAEFPTVKYLLDPGDLDGIYMVPPVRYEDRKYYIKMGANTRFDEWFTDLGEVQRWFNTDTDPHYLETFSHALRALWPSLDFVSLQTRPCIITYTPDGMPLIDQLTETLFVATAGNGAGAKGSDAWGALAADVVHRSLVG